MGWQEKSVGSTEDLIDVFAIPRNFTFGGHIERLSPGRTLLQSATIANQEKLSGNPLPVPSEHMDDSGIFLHGAEVRQMRHTFSPSGAKRCGTGRFSRVETVGIDEMRMTSMERSCQTR